MLVDRFRLAEKQSEDNILLKVQLSTLYTAQTNVRPFIPGVNSLCLYCGRFARKGIIGILDERGHAVSYQAGPTLTFAGVTMPLDQKF